MKNSLYLENFADFLPAKGQSYPAAIHTQRPTLCVYKYTSNHVFDEFGFEEFS